ncbi:MAG: CinA family protein [Rhodospirillales bacterium]|nr:CinA family protein [Rhodospirillales bacterium]
MTEDLERTAEALLKELRAGKFKVVAAESCTGGMLMASLTAIAGSSDVVERGYVTYSNDAKAESLGVPVETLQTHGSVSEPTARAMAEGALRHSKAQISVAITGVAGPGGGTAEKPVGLVHMAAARQGRPTMHQCHVFAGDRTSVRIQSVAAAFALIRRQIGAV